MVFRVLSLVEVVLRVTPVKMLSVVEELLQGREDEGEDEDEVEEQGVLDEDHGEEEEG